VLNAKTFHNLNTRNAFTTGTHLKGNKKAFCKPNLTL